MKTFAKSMLIGLTVLGLGTASLAARADDTTTAPAGRHGHAMDQAQMQAKMADMWAKRQQKLHDLLKLTSAQEGAWSTYQAAIKPAAPAGPRPDRAAIAAMSAPDRLSKMIDMSKQHETAMEAHLAALNAFYGQLTADQKTIFNDNTMGGKNAHHGHGRWGHHG
jgi:hypothetical protein